MQQEKSDRTAPVKQNKIIYNHTAKILVYCLDALCNWLKDTNSMGCVVCCRWVR